MPIEYVETNRIGEHIGWVSDVGKFKRHYPAWKVTLEVGAILAEIYGHNRVRWAGT